MNKVLSNKIYYATFIMAILVISIHSSFAGYLDPNASGYTFGLITQRVFLTLGDAAVPTFFVISGYLLFNNYVLKDYPKMLLKKLFSLVIPYFIWSITGFIFLEIVTPAIIGEPIELTFKSVVLDILLSNASHQIWFIRTLFVFCVCSPLIYFLFIFLKKWSIFIPIAVFVVYIFFRPDYFGIVFWIPLFFVGCYLSYFKIPVLNVFKPRLIGAISLVLLITVSILLPVFKVNDSDIIYFIYRHISVVFLWTGFDVLYSLYEKEGIKNIFKISAFIFFSHFLLARLVEGLLILTIRINNYNSVLLFFITWISASILAISIGYVLKRFLNPVFKILSGRK